MAIATDSAIDFFGAQDLVVTGSPQTGAVTDTSFSIGTDAIQWTNDDDAPLASFVLTFQYPSGSILSDGVTLRARLMNIDGTADEPQPDGAYPGHFLGTFVPDENQATATDASYSIPPVGLLNNYSSQVYEFYIENNAGVTITAGWTLKITPKTLGPHG